MTGRTLSARHRPAPHFRGNVLCLSNVGTLATSLWLLEMQKGTREEAVVNLHSSRCVSVVTRDQQACISPIPRHYCAPIQHAGAPSV